MHFGASINSLSRGFVVVCLRSKISESKRHKAFEYVDDRSFTGRTHCSGDVLFACPTRFFAEELSSNGNRVSMYVFGHKPSFSGWSLDSQPAQFEDLDFVFGGPLREQRGTPQERLLSRRLIALVADFAKNG